MKRLRDNPGFVAIGMVVIWLALQVGLFFFGPRNDLITPHFGVRHGVDTKYYLSAAESLLTEGIFTGKPFEYLGYDFFVAFFLWSGLGQLGIVLAQALITGVAAYCLYRLACRLYDRRTGLLATFFYIIYADIHVWNYYILNDSLYTSMITISLFAVVEWRGLWRLALAGLVVLFTYSVRRRGIILLISIGLYLLYSLWRARRYKALVGLTCLFVVTSPITIKLIGNMMVEWNFVTFYAQGNIIWAYPEGNLKMPGLPPASLALVKRPFATILYFIAEKPGYFLKLGGMKLWYLFLHARPYYSDFHNYILVFTLVPSYMLAAWGLMSRTDHPADKVLLVSICMFQSMIVALTVADWDGRYLLVLLPIVFIFSARGAWCALETVKARMDVTSKRKVSLQ